MEKNNTKYIKLRNTLSKHVGIENLITVRELSKKTGIEKRKVANAVSTTMKKQLRSSDLFLRNGRVWHDIDGNFYTKGNKPPVSSLIRKSGYYIVRLDNGQDIIPPEDIDFRSVSRHFKSFIDIWKNIDTKALTKEEREQIKIMEKSLIEVVFRRN